MVTSSRLQASLGSGRIKCAAPSTTMPSTRQRSTGRSLSTRRTLTALGDSGSDSSKRWVLKLLLDEMVDPEIGAQLRRRGWEVESIQGEHQDLFGLDDAVVLERATQLGRALVTDNVRHFLPLHQRYLAGQKIHAGLLLAHPRAYPRSKKAIGVWVRGLHQVLQRLASGSAENLCEWLP